MNLAVSGRRSWGVGARGGRGEQPVAPHRGEGTGNLSPALKWPGGLGLRDKREGPEPSAWLLRRGVAHRFRAGLNVDPGAGFRAREVMGTLGIINAWV